MGIASRRKISKHTQSVLARATDVVRSISGSPKICVRSNLSQEKKISNALSEILVDEVPEGAPLADYKTVLDLIVLAWNISLMDADQQPSAIQNLVSEIGMANSAANTEFQSLFRNLILKKQMRFPHDNRTIIIWDVWFAGDKIRVSASALVPPGNI